MSKKITAKSKKINKHLLMAVIAAVIVLVGVVALILFMQSPERMLARGFANLVRANTLGIDANISTGTVGYPTQSLKINGITDKKVARGQIELASTSEMFKLNAKADVIMADDKAIYVKVSNPDQTIDSYKSSITDLISKYPQGLGEEQKQEMIANVGKQLDPVREKLGSWIKFSQEDLKTGVSNTGVHCYQNFLQSLSGDNDARKQLAEAYMRNNFFKVTDKLGSEGASRGYKVQIDHTKLKEFRSAIASNDAVKKLDECGANLLTLGSTDSLSDHSIEVWVNRLSGKITRIKQSAGANAADVKVSYGGRVDAAVPENSVPFKDVISNMSGAILGANR